MSKSVSVVLGAIVLLVAGGLYAYQEMGWFKKKPGPEPEPEYKKVKPLTADEVARKSEHVVPDLTDLDVEDAKKALAKAGFGSDALDVKKDTACAYASDKDMKSQGSICQQDPPPGTKVSGTTKIKVVVEVDTFEHGSVGYSNEWRRMPALVGETVESARQILRDKGFGDDEFKVESRGADCAKGTVCATDPEAGMRKVKVRPGTLQVAN